MANAKIGSHPSYSYQLVDNIDSSFDLSLSDSGKVLALDGTAAGGAITVGLPTLSTAMAGFNVKLVVKTGTAAHIVNDGNSKIHAHCVKSNASSDTRLSGVSSITFTTASAVGDIIEICTDGTLWYATCFTTGGIE